MSKNKLSEFIADVVLTSHYLAEPINKSDVEVTDAEIRCLKIIASFQPIGMQEIAQKLHASKPRATQLVALLETRNMVERTVASDRRRIEVRASAKGRRVIKKLDERYKRLAAAIEKKLGKKDAETLSRLLEAITPLSHLDT
jgi:DNA-binding MarR family transcriptional regulator